MQNCILIVIAPVLWASSMVSDWKWWHRQKSHARKAYLHTNSLLPGYRIYRLLIGYFKHIVCVCKEWGCFVCYYQPKFSAHSKLEFDHLKEPSKNFEALLDKSGYLSFWVVQLDLLTCLGSFYASIVPNFNFNGNKLKLSPILCIICS